MDLVGLEQVCLFGNSVGCQVAVEYAICAPARVCHLVLEAPTMDASVRRVAPHVWRVTVDAMHEPVSLGPLQVADWARVGPRRLARTTRHAFEHAIESGLPLVACPTLVVRGGRDPIVPQRWAETVAAAGATATLHTVDGGSHAMPYSRPAVLANVIAEFVSRP
jgi:pimeloyl-ACP methyl ester carboxylesterase